MLKNLTRFSLLLFALLCLISCSSTDGSPDETDGDSDSEIREADGDEDGDPEPELIHDGDMEMEAELEPELEAEMEELPEEEAETESEVELPPDPGFDAYNGSLKVQTEASGYFRTEKIGEQWWLITPDGHPFFSTGINVLGPHGTATHDGVRHYYENIIALYGDVETWTEVTYQRCMDWGWNTVGSWSAWDLFKDRMPYTIIIYIAHANTPTLDFFSDEFAQLVLDRISVAVTPNVEDPYLIGYFMDNEMHWGPDLYFGDHFMVEYMAFSAADSAGKQRLIEFLEARYGSIAALKAHFETDAESFAALAEETELPPVKVDDELLQGAFETRRAWAGLVAEKYFKMTDEAFRAIDPNHLNLGVRFVSQLVPGAVIEAAGKYVDVMTINFYDLLDGLPEFLQSQDPDLLPIENYLEQHYLQGGKPIMVTEWGFRAMDAGLPNTYPPIYPNLDTQEDRADAYELKFRGMLERSWFVGQHWFLYADQPPEGRFDGEDNNFGLVSEMDVPYDVLVERSAMMYGEIYKRLPWPSENNDDSIIR